MAGKGLKGWQDAKAEATKIIGKQGKLPKPRVDVEAAMDAANKIAPEVIKLRDTLESKIVASQDAFAKIKNAAVQYSDMVASSNFDLDENKPDDKKLIVQAQKVLSSQLDEIETRADELTKIYADLDKVLIGLEKAVRSAS